MKTAELRLLSLSIFLGITGLFAYAASKFTPGKIIVIITAVGFLGFIVAFTILARKLKGFWQIARAAVLSLMGIIAGTYLLLFVVTTFFQDAIVNKTSSFFQPRTISMDYSQAVLTANVTALDLTTPEGIHLRGWLVRNSTEAKTPLVIYFGGSGSESSEIIPFTGKLTGWSVALVNYRGFGLSEGTPTHQNVLADALFIYDTLTARDDIDSGRIVSMGYSLGTGVAVYLSEQRPVAGTILVSPYDQWTLIGLKHPPFYAPLEGILKPYFDSRSRAPGITSPMLCLLGSNDTFVPPELSLKLVNDWGGKTKALIYQGDDHGLLFHDNSSWNDMLTFLQSLLQR